MKFSDDLLSSAVRFRDTPTPPQTGAKWECLGGTEILLVSRKESVTTDTKFDDTTSDSVKGWVDGWSFGAQTGTSGRRTLDDGLDPTGADKTKDPSQRRDSSF